MHELSIALSIIEGAEQAAAIQEAARVTAVYVRIGALSGVVPEALDFSFGIASEGTLLEGARLVIEEVPVRLFCEECQAETNPMAIQCLLCARCGGSDCRVIQGDEMELSALEIEEGETDGDREDVTAAQIS